MSKLDKLIAIKPVIGRCIAARILNENPEKVDLILKKDLENKKLEESDSEVIKRLSRPISDREISKWENKDITRYEWEQISLCFHASGLFEFIVFLNLLKRAHEIEK